MGDRGASFEMDRVSSAPGPSKQAQHRAWNKTSGEDGTGPRVPLIEDSRRSDLSCEVPRSTSLPAAYRYLEPGGHTRLRVTPTGSGRLNSNIVAEQAGAPEVADRSEGSGSSSIGSESDGAEVPTAAAAGKDSGKQAPLRYTVIDVPPWYTCIILGFQHYLTMLGSTVVIPALLVPTMGGTPEDHARVIQTIFFVSGINTLIQTTIGDRLPIVQGGSFSFLKPAFSIIAIIKATQTFETEHDRFLYTMRELQGSIIGSSLLVMMIGYSGAMGFLLRFISPVVVAPTVCMVGLSLYSSGFSGVASCMEQGLLSILAVIMFSQVLKRVEVPLPRGVLSRPSSRASLLLPNGNGAAALGGPGDPSLASSALREALAGGRRRGSTRGLRIFELFPLLWSILLTWAIAAIMTAAGVYNNASASRQAACRTDNMEVVKDSPWIYVPYPLQWGTPIFKASSIITMAAGALAAMIESTGDYYACARMSGAPVPPPYVISRGIGAEGLGCLMSGLFGTGNGTTSYAENIGAIGLTGVGSRRVVQSGAAIMLLLAIFGKFGGLFASLPNAIISGLFCCVFGLIAAVGLSNLQFTDQNSSRNMFIVGFALYMALSVPSYFDTYASANNGAGPINTSSTSFNDIANTLFSTAMCVALIIALVLDNLIAGTPEERGLTHWATNKTSKAAARRGRQRAAAAAAGIAHGASSDAAAADNVVDNSYNDSDDDTDEESDPRNDPRIKAVYDLPYPLQQINDRFILPYRRAAYRGLRRGSRAARRQWRQLLRRVQGWGRGHSARRGNDRYPATGGGGAAGNGAATAAVGDIDSCSPTSGMPFSGAAGGAASLLAADPAADPRVITSSDAPGSGGQGTGQEV